MICSNCGKEVEGNLKFCPSCGSELQQTAPKKKNGKWKLILALIVILAIAGAGLFFYLKTRVQITIENDSLKHDKQASVYYPEETFVGFSGTIHAPQKTLDSASYTITDSQGVTIQSGALNPIDNKWSIPHPSLLAGKNTLSVTAKSATGKEITSSISVVIDRNSPLLSASLDLSDNDSDGIANYLEEAYGTDISKADTDEDGLSDAIELFVTATDPLKYASLEDEICDGDRDSDQDSIPNKEELNSKLDPGCPDTDGDGLSDGEEVKQHKTDPLRVDTDRDSADDGWEVANGYDPLVSNVSFDVTVSSSYEGSSVQASVSLNTSSNPGSMDIKPIRIPGILDETTPGYIGTAYDFDFDESFSWAEITMNFDPSQLEEGADPVIYYYNEETQSLEPMETVVEDGVARAAVSHFSIYILLNRVPMEEVIQKDLMSEADASGTLLNVALVVDYSGSMNSNDPDYTRINIAKEYILKLRDDHDTASVTQFAGVADVLVPTTTDKTNLINGIQSITNDSDGCSSNSGTNGSAGIKAGLEQIESFSGATDKYLIFLTDGEDTTSSYDYDDLIAEANANNVVIYTIGMGSCNQELMERIAHSTGGEFYYATAGDISLKDAFTQIEEATLDNGPDENDDGITDYYAQMIANGELTTSTGTNPFGDTSYEDLQSNIDVDGDGLLNGEEVFVTYDANRRPYLEYLSSPIEADTDMDGYRDRDDSNKTEWDVGDRDLAIFSVLCFEDASNLIGSMYSNITGNPGDEFPESGASFYFGNNADLTEGPDRGILKKWTIVDYVNETSEDGSLQFSATVYQNGSNTVIAYRGSNSDVTEWINGIVANDLKGYHSAEHRASEYAKKIAAAYPQTKLYLTGYSLGGYLAQVGTIALVKEGIIPERTAYFNSYGISYELPETLLSGMRSLNSSSLGVSIYQAILMINDALEAAGIHTCVSDKVVLDEFYNKDEDHPNLVGYAMAGDVISYSGVHAGKLFGDLRVLNDSIARHKGHVMPGAGDSESWTFDSVAGQGMTNAALYLTGMNINSIAKEYDISDLGNYFWSTHAPDSFFFYITQGTRKSPGADASSEENDSEPESADPEASLPPENKTEEDSAEVQEDTGA